MLNCMIDGPTLGFGKGCLVSLGSRPARGCADQQTDELWRGDGSGKAVSLLLALYVWGCPIPYTADARDKGVTRVSQANR